MALSTSRRLTGRGSMLAAAALIACTLNAAPAYATVQKTGSKSCGYQQYVTIVSRGGGTIRHYAGSTLKATYYHGPDDMFTDTTGTGRNSTTWKVTSTGGSLSDSGTYATCSPSPTLAS